MKAFLLAVALASALAVPRGPALADPACQQSMQWGPGKLSRCLLALDPGKTLWVFAAAQSSTVTSVWVNVRAVVFTYGRDVPTEIAVRRCSTPAVQGTYAACGEQLAPVAPGPVGQTVYVECRINGSPGGSWGCWAT